MLTSCLGPGVVCAADFEIEFGPALFEQPTVEKPATKETGFGIRMVIDGQQSYDSPLYQGLWPMTLEAFRGDRRIIGTNSVLSLPKLPTPNRRLDEPRRIVLPGMLIASNPAVSKSNMVEPNGAGTRVPLFMYNSPLYDGLWPMTIEAFKQSDMSVDQAVFTFNIAMSN